MDAQAQCCWSLQSVQLSTFTRTGQFRFIDGLNALMQGSLTWEDILQQIKDALGSFDNSTQPPLVIIDDITALLWAGHCSVRDVIQLASALRVLSRDVSLHCFVWMISHSISASLLFGHPVSRRQYLHSSSGGFTSRSRGQFRLTAFTAIK